jgi:hypothetical protein
MVSALADTATVMSPEYHHTSDPQRCAGNRVGITAAKGRNRAAASAALLESPGHPWAGAGTWTARRCLPATLRSAVVLRATRDPSRTASVGVQPGPPGVAVVAPGCDREGEPGAGPGFAAGRGCDGAVSEATGTAITSSTSASPINTHPAGWYQPGRSRSAPGAGASVTNTSASPSARTATAAAASGLTRASAHRRGPGDLSQGTLPVCGHPR